ncbi:PLAT/LH2 domain-containing protein [Agromyces cerinus]|uniref:PLAT/LH2 domain-containing protein n=1 Tax=Agromyces cerinus subsp. cerinus TaxID=232089 RepID=A0A1N6E2P3_9MICO|nr:PLAT/LH2 domain-containing protein [Agromyces cerinus]SIN77325.1 PLAT/LH2 domain-containing protein [Agromyces cerinus subsp. cerinus]
MSASERIEYLLLLRRPSESSRREVSGRIRETGGRVLAEYGNVAVEALLTRDQVAAANDSGAFLAQLSGPMSQEHLAKLSDEQRRVVDLWNARHTNRFHRLVKDRTLQGRSWASEELQPPLPYSVIGPEDFLDLVHRFEREVGEAVLPTDADNDDRQGHRTNAEGSFDAESFREYESLLVKQYGDERLGYELARLAARLGPAYYDVILRLPEGLIQLIIDRFFREAACWRMTGEMAVGLVFVESSRRDGPKFTTAERNDICNEVLTGLNWLAAEHPGGNLTWVYDFQFVKIDVANGNDDSLEGYWRDPAMGEVSYNGNTYAASWSGVGDYREDMRLSNLAAHALVIFITPYGNEWHAYASSGRITLARRDNWGGWGRGSIDMITAHEASHLFGAADEYTGSGTPCSSCSTTHGCDRVPNGNCGACASPRQSCAMDGNSRRLCGYTRGQIGWGHLFVELTTADELWAGTDDDVWVDIGDHVFTLDTSDHDDRERGNREGYPVWAPWLRRQDVRRVLIRKGPDGSAGGWKLLRVRVWTGGQIICDSRPNRWLEDDHRFWLGCVTDRNVLNSLVVRVTTADVSWAGTDDDVTLTLAGRSWNLDNDGRNDFERGNTDTFTLDPGTGLRVSSLASVRLHKSPDGVAGGWRLRGVEIVANGATIYNNQSINRWLEDDTRTWSAAI